MTARPCVVTCADHRSRRWCVGTCRYSPNFSKRCTHLIVSTEQNDASQLKLYLASINKDKWHAQAVRFDWLLECATQHRQVGEESFVVEPPKYEVGCVPFQTCCMHIYPSKPSQMQDLSVLQQRLQEVATPTLSVAEAVSTPSEASSLVSVNKASMLKFMQSLLLHFQLLQYFWQ